MSNRTGPFPIITENILSVASATTVYYKTLSWSRSHYDAIAYPPKSRQQIL